MKTEEEWNRIHERACKKHKDLMKNDTVFTHGVYQQPAGEWWHFYEGKDGELEEINEQTLEEILGNIEESREMLRHIKDAKKYGKIRVVMNE